jgi:hypothetical protein
VLEVKLTEHHGFYHAFRIGDNIGDFTIWSRNVDNPYARKDQQALSAQRRAVRRTIRRSRASDYAQRHRDRSIRWHRDEVRTIRPAPRPDLNAECLWVLHRSGPA